MAASILAKRLVNQGADAIIAEGMESGGHVGEMTTMALVPQVIDAVDVPVIAAGGIADGRQAAAAFALGACGIQVGTCLLASRECPIHENYKLALLKAKDSDTTVTGRSIGGPVRVLKNKMAREYLALEKRGATLEELEQRHPRRSRAALCLRATWSSGSVMAGQVAGMLHEIKPLRQIFEELYTGSQAVLKATEAAWR
ncbi:MAG: nitronate monooxygenase [Dysosmobacter sp.]